MSLHGSVMVAEDAVLADADVGPFCVLGLDGVGPPLRIGPGARLRSHVVMYRGTVAGTSFHAGHHVLVRDATVIGNGVSVGSGTIVEHHVNMADGVRLHSNCFIPEHSVLEAGVWLGPGVMLTNARHPNQADTKDHLEGVLVETNAVLGAGVVVLPGVVIGAGALIGAGSVVVRDVPPGGRIVGNPGRAI